MALPRLMSTMAPRLFTMLTGHNVPKIIRGSAEPRPSIIDEKTVADFKRMVEETDILDRHRNTREPVRDKD